jgi:hypothetical protein
MHVEEKLIVHACGGKVNGGLSLFNLCLLESGFELQDPAGSRKSPKPHMAKFPSEFPCLHPFIGSFLV